MRQLINTIMIIAMAAAFSGCAEKAKQESSTQPRMVAVPGYAQPAVEAIGGQAAWNQTQAITGDCVVKIYNAGDAVYLTQQRHAIYPWSDAAVRILDTEPQGKYIWQFLAGNLTLMQGSPDQAKTLPSALTNRSTAEAIWSMMAVPARLATGADPNARLGEPIRIDGVWYYALPLQHGRTYFLNRSSRIIDACLLPQDGGGFVLVRGYSYQAIPGTLVIVPQKIELFNAEKNGEPHQKIMDFNYSVLKSFGFGIDHVP